MTVPSITAEHVRRLLNYDKSTGVFTWAIDRNSRVKAGDRAGCDKKGYVRIKFDGVDHFAHRLAWLVVHGAWPEGEIDHINGLRSDNRIANLRDVSKAVNQQNRKSHRGYSWHIGRRKWYASIVVDGRNKHLGQFKDEGAAKVAYWSAKERLHEGYVP